jgi:hypothetical protein
MTCVARAATNGAIPSFADVVKGHIALAEISFKNEYIAIFNITISTSAICSFVASRRWF